MSTSSSSSSSSESPPSPSSSFWSNLSIYARAGLVIACILAFLFLLSTTILCIVRRGRLITTARRTAGRRRGPSVPKREYRRPPAPDKKSTHSTTVEVQDGDEDGYAGQSHSEFGAAAVALHEYDGRYGYAHAYRYGDGDGDRGHGDGYAGDESTEREQTTWDAV